MTTILKGDTSKAISITLWKGYDWTTATLEVIYQGARRTFVDCRPGDTLELSFTAEETGSMSLGAFPFEIRVKTDAGRSFTVHNADAKIRVTDCVSEVSPGGVVAVDVAGGLAGIADLPENYTDKDVVSKIREILRRGGAALCAILAFAIPAFAADVVYTPKEDVYNKSNVVTRVDFAGLATERYVQDAVKAGGVDTNAVNDLIAAATNAITPQSIGAQTELPRDDIDDLYDISVHEAKNAWWATYAEQARKDDQGNDIAATYAKKSELAGVSETVSAWQTYWDGDDVRVTVTNYYGSMGLPALYIEQKMAADDEHENTWFKIIWDERTRWNAFLSGYTALTNHVQNDLADRAWGVYDSSTGAYSPDGLLQLSQERIMIAAGMAWQKTVTAGGCAVWVLKATNPTTLSGQTENGFFRIEDGDGNALFEIVKGDKRVVGATATGISIDGGVMTISYNSVSDEHPTLEICTDLKLSDWETETATTAATVSWSGSSGAWIVTVTPVGARASLFAKATFEAGGNTYIRNNVATSIDKVVVGGIEYEVTVETVNGKKLLVLK